MPMKRFNTEDFVRKGCEIHGNRYTYQRTEYKNDHTDAIITCPRHGDFVQNANYHIQGRGCPECGPRSTRRFIARAGCPECGPRSTQRFIARAGCPECGRRSTQRFIARSRQVHGNKYSYRKCSCGNVW